jgi:hypothetical protein
MHCFAQFDPLGASSRSQLSVFALRQWQRQARRP